MPISAPGHELTNTPFVRCGQIHFGGSHFRFPCVVKALSEDSAHLHVFGANRLPERFWLFIETIGLEVECEVHSRSEKTVTVSFCGHHPEANKPSRNPQSQPSTGDAPLPRLWVVEDDEDDCTMLSDAFRQQNVLCEMSFFSDGEAFLEYLNARDALADLSPPGLTLLDLNMPRMGGVATLSALRSDARYRHLPVVVFTTSNNEHDIQETYTLGVSAYLTKPSREEDLHKVVNFITTYWTTGVKLPARKNQKEAPSDQDLASV